MPSIDPITTFYRAFQKLDAEVMVSQYHDQVTFTDPAFGTLRGKDAKDMWRMLCSRSKDLMVTYSDVVIQGANASAQWQATYTFGTTGRQVRNQIVSEFFLADGKIIKHVDDFDLRKWAGQALGWQGSILGGTGFFRNRLQKRTGALLLAFQSEADR